MMRISSEFIVFRQAITNALILASLFRQGGRNDDNRAVAIWLLDGCTWAADCGK